MMKEIDALLKSDEDILKINRMFHLRRWTKSLDMRVDKLVLELNESPFYSINIVSRDYEGIKEEVYNGMEEIMNTITLSMQNRWKGGLLR